MSDLDAKLDTFDRHAPDAVDFLIRWLANDRAALIAVAKGRHVEGHYRYADKLMYEYSPNELMAEASQELGDAINYIGRLLSSGGVVVPIREGVSDDDPNGSVA